MPHGAPRWTRGDVGREIGAWILAELRAHLVLAGIDGRAIDASHLVGVVPPAVAALALDDLTDVAAAAPTDGQVLAYDATGTQWVSADATGGAGMGGMLVAREEFAPAAAATTVTLANTPTTVLDVARNGVVQSVADGHYGASGAVLTFTTAFDGADRVVVSYAYGAAAVGGMPNPMTTLGDLITGDTGGVPIRLGAGTSGQMLVTLATGALGWATPATSTVSGEWRWRSAFQSGPPIGAGDVAVDATTATVVVVSTTTNSGGDVTGILERVETDDLVLIQDKNDSTLWRRYRVTGTPTVASGAATIPVAEEGAQGGALVNNQVCVVAFAAAGGAGGGMTNPMTSVGDLIVGGAAGAPGRLGIGTDNQVLTVVAGAVAWADVGVLATVLTDTAGDALADDAGDLLTE